MKGTYTTYKSWLTAAKKAGAVRLDGDKDIAMAFGSDGRGVAEWDGAEGYVYKVKSMIDGKMIFENPKGVYTTYGAWRAAAKKAGAMRFEGDKDIAQAFDNNGRGVAEWDGAEGYIYKTKSMIDGKMIFTNPAHRPNDEDPLDAIYVEYMRPMQDEEPFMMGGSKYEFVRARYPDGRMDIAVYSQRGDVTYGYRHWRQMMGIEKSNPVHSRNPKQRIGISLSKNRKRNPVYDTGSDE